MGEDAKHEPRLTAYRRDLEIRGANYCLWEWGEPDAPLIVYLHGWADTGSTFQFVVDRLQGSWRVVAPDWRGFGRSTCATRSYWFPDYLADLDEILAAYSPKGAVRLIGHSMGGNIAGLYAGTMPERVRALVNIEGFGLRDSDPADAPGRYRAWIEAMREDQPFSRYAGLESLATRILRRHPGMDEGAAMFVARQWGIEGEDGSVVLCADPRHRLPNPVLYRRAEARACWQAIEADVLLVSGSQSDIAARAGTDATRAFPGSRSVVIDGAGHMLHFEAPQRLAEEIEGFLGPTL